MSDTTTGGAPIAHIVRLGDDASISLAVAGGKGASLGRLARAGFPVPPGFVVTTAAWRDSLRSAGLDERIAETLRGLDLRELDILDRVTADIRRDIRALTLPDDLRQGVRDAYAGLGADRRVAVRSSGTAEDLEDASFAGQYDTLLDVSGAEALLDALLSCWASMWTARVTAYREDRGIDHLDVAIAVVVQTMIVPDVAGVMFVGNPMSARADEVLINASWGLGEAIVSGRITPDEYVAARDSGRVKRRVLGSKELEVVRDPDGSGTLERTVPPERRTRYALDDDTIAELAALGRRVTALHDGLPQDTEWAVEGGRIHLLQSRPVTGVEFTWEEDLDLWPELDEDEDTIWTRAWADEVWTGAITPLMWSIRGAWMKYAYQTNFAPFRMANLADLRAYRYARGTAYYNTRADELIAQHMLPPALREPLLRRLHPSQQEAALAAPYELGACIAMVSRVEREHPEMGILGDLASGSGMGIQGGEAGFAARREQARATVFPTDAEVAALSDPDLRARIEVANRPFHGAGLGGWGRIFIWYPTIRALLEGVLRYWYDGDNASAYNEIISGLPERTQQAQDDRDFWALGRMIRESPALRALIDAHEGAEFFAALEHHPEGREFLAHYEAFLEMNFYRGHADRDMYFPRRVEDPMIDCLALRQLASTEGLASPAERETALNRRREAATAEVVANLAAKPLGELKVAIFNVLLRQTLLAFAGRDNSRPMSDIVTWNKKVLVKELGRRTVSRGLLESPRDFWFLSLDEIYRLMDGEEPVALARAKARARARTFDRFLTHEVDPPMFLAGDRPLPEQLAADADGVLRGTGTSPGRVTGRARIVPTLEDIGRLEKGDILVCHGTDPGWTPIFSLVSGVVAQTGGAIAHFSCLSREYGIPAVSLPGAMKLIPDGATIAVDGSAGEVRLGAA